MEMPDTLRLIFWELTKRCNLACKHCRARAYYVTGGYLDEEPYCIYDPKEKG
jgi:MoaA/NifB/PqqE/SkfB family radical SAM enzyme